MKLSCIDGKGTNPYENLALEEFLLHDAGDDEIILYLWQNRKTVVIGKNQNPWKECRAEELEADGGYLARRLSGGGAVFHDLGNLNFTFLAKSHNYDVIKQTEVILKAVESYGVTAERSGRNDITVEGKKFSGNAYYQTGDCSYHHGTILLSADKQEMAKYLNVSREKLQSKGVDSVKSRVGNLIDFIPDITVESMRDKLKAAFGTVYGIEPVAYDESRLSQQTLIESRDRFASWDWKYGRKIMFTDQCDGRFSWGGVEIEVCVEKGLLKEIKVYSDAMDSSFIELISACLAGCMWNSQSVYRRIQQILCESKMRQCMKQDVQALISTMF